MPEILSVREHPEWAARAIVFFQRHWGTEENRVMYDDCITHALTASGALPQWYVLSKGEAVLAGAALLPNDLISRMDTAGCWWSTFAGKLDVWDTLACI